MIPLRERDGRDFWLLVSIPHGCLGDEPLAEYAEHERIATTHHDDLLNLKALGFGRW
jgi:hypothetical protein